MARRLPLPPSSTPTVFQEYVAVVCPFCRAPCPERKRRPRVRATFPHVRYYRCQECDLLGDGGTTFKVAVRPEGPRQERV